MDNAIVINNGANPSGVPGFGERLLNLPVKAKLGLIGGLMAMMAVLMAMAMYSNQGGNYKVLFANVSDKDGGAIIAQLSQMNIPYKFSEGGAAILVPSDKVHDARLKLATAGLPHSGTTGFELMDNARFGLTQFQERLNFQRGLEGELIRSITSMAAVQTARVHLALPSQNGFFREQQKPSASVLLTLHPGRTLDRSQIAGIVHLVSSSVPELNPKSVSVLDQTGALLSDTGDNDRNAGLDAQQIQYLSRIEQSYSKRIFDLLEPVVGRENLRTTVTADIDFTQSEATSEEFRPNQGADASVAIRSQQTTEQTGANPAMPTGVPGATSNQPPLAAAAPLTGASQPLQAAGGGAGSSNSRREAVTNYEVDKTVRVVRNATGVIKRLNAAVVVNHRTSTDAKGKTKTEALSPEDIEKLTTLVREAVGYKPERGDSVKVINAPFKVEKFETPNIPWWKQPEVIDFARSAVVPVGLAVLGLVIFFGFIRPALKAALEPPPPVKVEEVVDDQVELPEIDVKKLEAPPSPNLEVARNFTRENPVAAASIVRGWVSGEAN
jgi:flagellar M-ring protein FliF